MVGEASSWEVVKAALVAEYAMPQQEAWRQFVNCQFGAGNTVDVYLDCLEQFGKRLGMFSDDLGFRVKFYEGLPSSVYEWAIAHEHAYSADFGSVLARNRLGRKSAAGKKSEASANRDCFRCGSTEHLVASCPRQRARDDLAVGSASGGSGFHEEGADRAARPLQWKQNTRSERTLVSPRVVVGLPIRPGQPLLTADSKVSHMRGRCRVINGLHGHCFCVTAPVISESRNLGVDCLLGGDVIDHMGGVTVGRGVDSKYSVLWGNPHREGCCGVSRKEPAFSAASKAGDDSGPSRWGSMSLLLVEDSDFIAEFAKGHWTVSWRWSGELPNGLQTRISEYKCTQAPQVPERCCAELKSWISKGWLKRWHGPVEGIIPLLAVVQPTKDKVRPVMDYRELNAFVEKWRQLQGELKVLDLKSAYLQIHISKDLWKYQVVRYKGVHYALIRLGFGLSCAPRIMTSILKKVLSLDERVHRGTDHYIDDIVVQESVLSAQGLRDHLARYGLETKEPEALDGGRLLGVALQKDSSGHLQMSKGTALSEYNFELSPLTKRELFSICDRLVGHYPVAGWLRPQCSFLKRLGCSGAWDSPVGKTVSSLASELLAKARREEPVKGVWRVNPRGSATV
ncbi:uncharacterized protein [Watersipora subatra]|uniref:uncharacterized protein n=1 Tax=Watersipora subatra TaxID=2589382 RepID=UPI00355B83E8